MTKQTFIVPQIAIGRVDGEPITEGDLDDFIDAFLEFIESRQYECGGGWTLRDESGQDLLSLARDFSRRGSPLAQVSR